MTDLDRAREILAGYPPETAQHVIAEALATARRDGRTAGLEEAAQTAENLWSVTGKEFASAIRALKPEA